MACTRSLASSLAFVDHPHSRACERLHPHSANTVPAHHPLAFACEHGCRVGLSGIRVCISIRTQTRLLAYQQLLFIHYSAVRIFASSFSRAQALPRGVYTCTMICTAYARLPTVSLRFRALFYAQSSTSARLYPTMTCAISFGHSHSHPLALPHVIEPSACTGVLARSRASVHPGHPRSCTLPPLPPP